MTTATTYNKYQIYGILKNYHWMLREIQRIDKELSTTDFKGTAQYGIEATMPRAQGIVSRALENEVLRRCEKSKKLVKYCEQINFINERSPRIIEEKEKVILDCLLDGMGITAISHHLRTSRKHINELRDNIVDKLA
jgi:DNA-binding NarL/FixJ family response regulator